MPSGYHICNIRTAKAMQVITRMLGLWFKISKNFPKAFIHFYSPRILDLEVNVGMYVNFAVEIQLVALFLPRVPKSQFVANLNI